MEIRRPGCILGMLPLSPSQYSNLVALIQIWIGTSVPSGNLYFSFQMQLRYVAREELHATFLFNVKATKCTLKASCKHELIPNSRTDFLRCNKNASCLLAQPTFSSN